MSAAAPSAASNPYIGEYEAYSAQAKTAYQRALAQITNQRASYLQGYGLDAQGNPVADNPFGAYQQLMSSDAQSAEASDAALRGQGFTGGLSNQAKQAAQRMVEQGRLQFGAQFQQGLSSLSQGEEQAGFDYNTGLENKMLELTQRAAQDRAFNPADFSGLNYEGYGDASPQPAAPGLPWKPPTQAPPHFPHHPPKHKNRNRRRRR